VFYSSLNIFNGIEKFIAVLHSPSRELIPNRSHNAYYTSLKYI